MTTQQGDSQPSLSSQTTTQTQTQTNLPTLVLRAESSETGRHITWAEDVVDNEGLNKKSSKVCCIWHPPTAAGESSESSSSSSDSSDESGSSGADDGRALPAGGARRSRAKKRRHHNHHHHRHDHSDNEDEHKHGNDPGEGSSRDEDKRILRQEGKRKPSPNAYERIPKLNSKRKDGESSTGQ